MAILFSRVRVRVAPIAALLVAICACLCLLYGSAAPADAASSASILSAAPGSPVALPTGSDPQGIAFGGRFAGTLSVADMATDAVSALGVDSSTGSLRDVRDVSTPAGVSGPQFVAAQPAGDVVAVGADESGGGVILLYSQDASGALTYLGSTSVGLDGDLSGLAWSPDGSELVAASDDRVTTYSVGSRTVAPVSWTTLSGVHLVGVAVGGSTVAAIDDANRDLVTWNNANDGLADQQTTPLESADTPSAIAFRPRTGDTGRDVFAVAENYQDNDKLVQWETAAGNAGAAVAGMTSALDGKATSLAFDGDGKMVAAAQGSTVSLYTLGYGLQGITSDVPGSPIDSGGATFGSAALNSAGTRMAVDESGGSDGDAVEVYSIAQPTVTFTASPGQTVTQGTPLTIHFTCHVPDGTTLTSCTDANGNPVATPSTSTPGHYTVEVTATDNLGQSTTASYTYTVIAATTTTTTTPPTTTGTPTTGTSTTTTTPTPTTPTTSHRTSPKLRIWNIKANSRVINWCWGQRCKHRVPTTRIRFELNRAAHVRLALVAKVHGHWRQVARTTIHGHKGGNRYRLAGRWHGQLVPARPIRLRVETRPGTRRWVVDRTLRLTVRHRRLERATRQRWLGHP